MEGRQYLIYNRIKLHLSDDSNSLVTGTKQRKLFTKHKQL